MRHARGASARLRCGRHSRHRESAVDCRLEHTGPLGPDWDLLRDQPLHDIQVAFAASAVDCGSNAH
eukprot:4666251-Prymnesium_polylepis.1